MGALPPSAEPSREALQAARAQLAELPPPASGAPHPSRRTIGGASTPRSIPVHSLLCGEVEAKIYWPCSGCSRHESYTTFGRTGDTVTHTDSWKTGYD